MADEEPTVESSTEEPKDLTEHWSVLNPRPALDSMSDEDLAKFVLGVCDDKIFTLHHIPERQRAHLAGSVFMPILFGAFSGWFEADLQKVGTVWEYRAEAGPRAINGYPMFMSCRVMSAADWSRAARAIDKELARRKIPVNILDDLKEPPP